MTTPLSDEAVALGHCATHACATPLLDRLDSPAELRHLDHASLRRLADELRSFILESVAATGGHLSANLGAVELTIALHRVFDTPRDPLVWDVGHQSYAHKILTGRKSDMARLRKLGGASGFTSRDESPYDAFGAGHAGTAVSAALGMAMSLVGREGHAVAIVGDGALSAGMVFEALNHAGTFSKLPLTIVLNDNGMSISPAVGALHRHLRELVVGSATHPPSASGDEGRVLGEKSATLFGLLGLAYTGPVDGHNLVELVAALEKARRSSAPTVVHVVTRKGRGYRPAELDPVAYHGPSAFDVKTGIVPRIGARQTYSELFGEWICSAAGRDGRIVGITPAMREGSCLVEFQKKFPDRFVDVAIAEQHAVTLAAGLAAAGMRPVVAIYSTFLQRGYDQVIHDVALQNLPVMFAIDRAGIAGGDGATHLGAFDLACLRCIPNLVLMTPADQHECYQMLNTGLHHPGPSAVRYPRAIGNADSFIRSAEPMPIGKGAVLRLSCETRRERVALLAFGPLLSAAMEVGEAIDATVANMRFVKPLDEALLMELAEDHDVLVTLEEATIVGGAGSACAERIAREGMPVRVLRLGLPDSFVPHGDRSELLAHHGLNASGILDSIRRFVKKVGVRPLC
jgi:1-deoxy-D-xylulose-5-phosphate synthase